RLGRYFFGFGQFPISARTLRLHDCGFWAVVVGALAFGVPRLVRARSWDRLALVVGLLAAVVSFHLIGGREALRGFISWYAFLRYGLFLVVPTAMALACLLRTLL